MVVTSVTRPAVGNVLPRRRGGEGRSFGVATEQAGQSESVIGTMRVAVTSLLALQENESGLQQDREARQHGTAMMDELSTLQRALLGEEEPDLHQLATLAARPTAAADPALAGVLQAVRLRAGIELARRGYAAGM